MWGWAFLLILGNVRCDEGMRGVESIGRVYQEIEDQEVEESDLLSYGVEDLLDDSEHRGMRGKRSSFYRFGL